MRITAVINGKGGVGKTSTAHALATGLDRRKYKTLALDFDPQGNLSFAFGADTKSSPTMFHVLTGEVTIKEAIQHTPQGDIIAGNNALTKIEALYSGDMLFEGIDKLKIALGELAGQYTHVFIDNQPRIGGIQTTQALTAATDLVVPTSAEIFALQGLDRLSAAINQIRRFNPLLKIDGILLAKYNPRLVLSTSLSSAIEKWATSLETRVYKTFIREGVAVKESQTKKQSLFDYAPTSNPSVDYLCFIEEYVDEEYVDKEYVN